MADTKISALSSVASVNTNAEFAVNDSGTSRKASAGQVSTFINSNISLGAALNVNSQEITSTGGTDITLHSDNDLEIILGDDAGIDDLNIRDSANAIVASFTSDGALTAVSYGGILEANLLDKSASETISGAFTFSTDLTVNANIVVTGTVDGRDVATDGAKLDTIEAASNIGTFTAGETLTAGDVVYMAADGKVYQALANGVPIEARVLGIANEAGTTNNPVDIVIHGNDTNQVGLTVGSPYFLSTTAGAISATAPTGSGEVIVRVGYATSATSINIQPTVIGVLS